MKEIKIAFFDCDGCLFNTPHPEPGKQLWAEFYNKEYPYQGWWGRVESMDMNVFTIKPRPEVYNYWKTLYDQGFETRVLTSRMPKFEPLIQTLLIDNNIDMKEVMTVKGSLTKGQRILETVKDYISQGYSVPEVHFFDDRMKEIVTVQEVVDDLHLLGTKVFITKVESDAND